MTKIIKLAVTDDHPIIIRGIELICSYQQNINIIFTACNGVELIEKIKQQRPNVVLLAIRMPCMGGAETTAYLKKRYKKIKIIVLTMFCNPSLVSKMLALGVDGYVLKSDPYEELLNAINSVMKNKLYLSKTCKEEMEKDKSKLPKKTVAREVNCHLSKREKEVLELICEEYTTCQIAAKMFVSERTIEGHRKMMLKKLNVRNTAGLVAFAFKNGLMD